ncbi:zinc-binding oxidoreductase CipB [Saccharata proteae CBS 121410]|uniref:Zinc-binding oxidoreductase CipB n=1 Tax=Saccharata proteae CBS 121410 TaxID=1314787 RepID=A0A9P4HLW7_9PEZI|nr:zinc-binding oxidoreductase CipB [Saccharata proteae CBS 121410]
MPANRAAWLTAKSARPLKVQSAPYTPPSANQIVVKNGAIAINLIDWSKQVIGDLMFSYMKYPFILGEDVAGEVIEVGSQIKRFKPGDRVLGHALAMDEHVNRAAEGGFQEYTILRSNMASPIPSSLSYESASVLPLCLSTAACGLFQKDFLALDHPHPDGTKPKSSTVLIWGGSTRVGSNAIQLAAAAGYEVITTASPKNFAYVKKLGAAHVFDYRSKNVVEDIISHLEGKTSAGAVAIGNGSTEACIQILSKAKGNKFVAQASFPWPEKMPTSPIGLIGLILSTLWWNLSIFFKGRTKRVQAKFIFGTTLMSNEVSRVIYEDFLPSALEQRTFVPAPEPEVVGKGLEFVQEALDLYQKGVSAKKVVVSL